MNPSSKLEAWFGLFVFALFPAIVGWGKDTFNYSWFSVLVVLVIYGVCITNSLWKCIIVVMFGTKE